MIGPAALATMVVKPALMPVTAAQIGWALATSGATGVLRVCRRRMICATISTTRMAPISRCVVCASMRPMTRKPRMMPSAAQGKRRSRCGQLTSRR